MARNKYPEETKKLIVDTAAALFAEKGYESTTIQDIVDHLGGLSKGAIYHHFNSKEEIMWAVAEKLYANSGREMSGITGREDLTGREKLKLLMQQSLEDPAQKEMFSIGLDMTKNPQLLVRYLQNTVQDEAPRMLETLLEEGRADGSIQTEFPRQVAEVLILLGDMWLNPLIYPCGSHELARRIEFFQYLLFLLGIDILEDSAIEKLRHYREIYQKSSERQSGARGEE